MDPAEYISFAGRVAGIGAAGARSAVSRAYYGAFHLAIAVLETFQCAPAQNAGSHQLVSEFLGCSDHPDARKAVRMLRDLHRDRIRADYRLHDSRFESFEFARTAVESAEDARRHLELFREACHEESVLDQLKQAIAELRTRRGL
jgi:uncharacterized protein (UPF0332 family)